MRHGGDLAGGPRRRRLGRRRLLRRMRPAGEPRCSWSSPYPSFSGCCLLIPVLVARAADRCPSSPRLLLAGSPGRRVTVELSLIYLALSRGEGFITASVGALGAAAAATAGLIGGDPLDPRSRPGWPAPWPAAASARGRPAPAVEAAGRCGAPPCAPARPPGSPRCSSASAPRARWTPTGQPRWNTPAPRCARCSSSVAAGQPGSPAASGGLPQVTQIPGLTLVALCRGRRRPGLCQRVPARGTERRRRRLLALPGDHHRAWHRHPGPATKPDPGRRDRPRPARRRGPRLPPPGSAGSPYCGCQTSSCSRLISVMCRHPRHREPACAVPLAPPILYARIAEGYRRPNAGKTGMRHAKPGKAISVAFSNGLVKDDRWRARGGVPPNISTRPAIRAYGEVERLHACSQARPRGRCQHLCTRAAGKRYSQDSLGMQIDNA